MTQVEAQRTMALSDIRGMTKTYSQKLNAAKVNSENDLLAAGKTPKGRRDLAKASGIDEKALLELLNRADLNRVKGIGEVYSNLLEEAGVDTIKELATRVPANLVAKLVEVNGNSKWTKRPPASRWWPTG